MFEYKAKMNYLKYYDKFPLVYVIKATKKGEFWGANLHYMTPKKRIMATKKLMEGKFNYNRKFGESLPTLEDFTKDETNEEINVNPASRSAKLRYAVKINDSNNFQIQYH